jgi:hypothetical protein
VKGYDKKLGCVKKHMLEISKPKKPSKIDFCTVGAKIETKACYPRYP